jgi:hypothetical protein
MWPMAYTQECAGEASPLAADAAPQVEHVCGEIAESKRSSDSRWKIAIVSVCGLLVNLSHRVFHGSLLAMGSGPCNYRDKITQRFSIAARL